MILTKPINEVTDKEWEGMSELDKIKYFVCQDMDKISLRSAKKVQILVQALAEKSNER